MPRDYSAQPPNVVRRRDRAVDDAAWICSFLHEAAVGTLATVHEGQPFLNSNLFVYDETAHAIYMHTAHVGRTVANVASGGADGQAVCFHAFQMGRLLPADRALEFSIEYEGVTVFGRATMIAEPEAAMQALQQLMDKYAPHLRPNADYEPPTTADLKRTAVYRIAIESWSGKRKSAPPDFPGAYLWRDEPNATP